jgi:hypothetical protein
MGTRQKDFWATNRCSHLKEQRLNVFANAEGVKLRLLGCRQVRLGLPYVQDEVAAIDAHHDTGEDLTSTLGKRLHDQVALDLDEALLQRLARLGGNNAAHVAIHLFQFNEVTSNGAWLCGLGLLWRPLCTGDKYLFYDSSGSKDPHCP